jgi:GTP cyclohydrolase II
MIKELNQWCDLPTSMGIFRMYNSGNEEIRIISYGDIWSLGDRPLLRMHSSCLASEVFGATDCDCADQLREAMKLIAHEGSGVIVHLNQEGRGQGLARKIEAVHLMQYDNLDTFEAFAVLGYEQDTRNYTPVVELLNLLGVTSIRLISNNPRKRKFLQGNSFKVELVNTHPNVRLENAEYLVTKNEKLGHSLPLEQQSFGAIKFYHSDQPWGELSNFSHHSIFLKNKIWPTVEHFYQAQKFAGMENEEVIRQAKTAVLAKKIARSLKELVRVDWLGVKQQVMQEGLQAKFSQHPDLAHLLISSGSRELIEHTENDMYWGDGGDGSGQNKLGLLIMHLRSELIADTCIQKKAG